MSKDFILLQAQINFLLGQINKLVDQQNEMMFRMSQIEKEIDTLQDIHEEDIRKS